MPHFQLNPSKQSDGELNLGMKKSNIKLDKEKKIKRYLCKFST